jgi:hypothetical protein
MRPSLIHLRIGAVAGLLAVTLAGCDTVMEGLVGPTKEEFEKQKAEAKAKMLAGGHPPMSTSQPLASAFVTDSKLMPGYAGTAILPPTLPTDTPAVGEDEPLPPSSAGPHPVLATVSLSSDTKELAPLAIAANRVRAAASGADASFVVLVLSPPATDASAMDKNNIAARDAAGHAVKVLSDAGIAADRVEISMATNPNVGNGEIRLYRR